MLLLKSTEVLNMPENVQSRHIIKVYARTYLWQRRLGMKYSRFQSVETISAKPLEAL